MEENYDYDEPTPVDTVVNTEDGPYILRMGEPPIEVGGGSREEQHGTQAEEIVREIIEDWRENAEVMDTHIDNPSDVQKFVEGMFRARANELEHRVLQSNETG